MAGLYRKPILIRDPKTGCKVKTKSKKWWGRYVDVSGAERRVPLAADKTAAQTMLNALVRKVERTKAGLIDPQDEQLTKPISVHVHDFETYLRAKGNTATHCTQTANYIRTVIGQCGFQRMADVTASQVQEAIAILRSAGKSLATCNHYLRAIKSFTRWLVRDRRTNADRLSHLSLMNGELDRRHERRPLSVQEFALLVEAAQRGRQIQKISGPDRAMLYALSAWTGFRKSELGSLTLQSFRLDDNPPTATVAACYSKRRPEDTLILHPELVQQIKQWLVTRPRLKPGDCSTAKMMNGHLVSRRGGCAPATFPHRTTRWWRRAGVRGAVEARVALHGSMN